MEEFIGEEGRGLETMKRIDRARKEMKERREIEKKENVIYNS